MGATIDFDRQEDNEEVDSHRFRYRLFVLMKLTNKIHKRKGEFIRQHNKRTQIRNERLIFTCMRKTQENANDQ